MTPETIQSVPDTATLFEISQQAGAKHLHLIHKGDRFALCSTVPAGWKVFAVAERGNDGRRAA